jgi:uncharacterized protein (DUF2336 family)
MAVPASLISELDVIAHGSPQRRARTLERIAALFLERAGSLNEDHVQLFDVVLTRLITGSDANVRAGLSCCLAPLGNAPVNVIRRLASDHDIAVARPVLEQSPRIPEADLIAVVETGSQAHLLAVARRPGLPAVVTDILVRRGNRDVVHEVVDRHDAHLSHGSFLALVDRAKHDGVLAVKIGLRGDIPAHLFRDLVLNATELVQRRLLAKARPEARAHMRRVLTGASYEVRATDPPRDYSAAQRTIDALRQQSTLDEATLVAFARTGQFEETVATLASLCAVPLGVVDRLMAADRPDPVLILAKSAGWGWPTAKAILRVRSAQGKSSQSVDAAHSIYERLSPATAQRVVLFWQLRSYDG